jgi:hypothetical protein
MAQLGIRDKNYRPNQYINPMLIGMGREPNQEDAPYRIFDKSNPEHPDYDKDDDEGDVQLELPLAKRNQSMTIAMDEPLADYDVTDKGYFMDYNGDMYMNIDGMLFPMGQGYESGTHGELVPKGLVQSMQINPDVAMFPRLSTGEPMTNIEKKQGIEVLRKTRDPKQIKLFIQQMMKGV